MVFQQYKYGFHKKQIKVLLRKRLSAQYHLRVLAGKQEQTEAKLKGIEEELNILLKNVESKV